MRSLVVPPGPRTRTTVRGLSSVGSWPARNSRGVDPCYGPPYRARGFDRLLAAARAGQSGVLVVRGEPGVGKSALLGYAPEAASSSRITRAAGVESEMELAYAGLHQLCAPLLDALKRLPAPQQDALATAFGLSSGTPRTGFSSLWRANRALGHGPGEAASLLDRRCSGRRCLGAGPGLRGVPLVDRWNPAWIDPLLAVHGKEGADRYEESRFPPEVWLFGLAASHGARLRFGSGDRCVCDRQGLGGGLNELYDVVGVRHHRDVVGRDFDCRCTHARWRTAARRQRGSLGRHRRPSTRRAATSRREPSSRR